jgi:hypothetical protein
VSSKCISLSIVFLISITFTSVLNAEILKKAKIKWNPIIGASKYKVEVKNDKEEVVFTKDVKEPQLEFEIPYGNYKYKVAIINKFNKIYQWSDWYKLSILPPLFPVITSVSPGYIHKGDDKKKIVLEGRNFYKGALVSLVQDIAIVPMKNIEYLSDEKISFEILSDDIVVGEYIIKVINPGNLESKSEIKFSVKKPEVFVGIFHHLGIDGAYFTPNVKKNSADNGFTGVGLFYEFHNIGKRFKALRALKKIPGFYIGTKFYFFSFISNRTGVNSDFGASYMIQFLIYTGYDFFFPIKNFYPFHVAPFIGYKHYLRWHTYLGQKTFGARPILPIGVDLSFDLPKKFFVGIIAEYNIIFDLTLVNIFGFSLRIGYKI